MSVQGISRFLDRFLERIFRRVSPAFRSHLFKDPVRQAVLLLAGVIVLILFGITYIWQVSFMSTEGMDARYEFVAGEEDIVVRELEGIDHLDDMEIRLSTNRSAALEFFVCHESEYEDWENGTKDAGSLDTVIHFNGTVSQMEFSESVNGDGLFYAVIVNQENSPVEVRMHVETTHPPRYFCGVFCLVSLMGAVLLSSAAVRVFDAGSGRKSAPFEKKK